MLSFDLRRPTERKMKTIVITLALLAGITSAFAQTADERAKEYRMWSAEQMITRLTENSRDGTISASGST
jgi:hypothetical protein